MDLQKRRHVGKGVGQLRVYILDDEKPGRGLLKYHLEKLPEIQIIGESGEPVPAIEEINELKPDLLFLDIDMPLLNGFEVLPYLKSKPLIIFYTAYDEYAVKAFEVNAIDYLVKPVAKARLQAALQRAGDCWERLEKLKDLDGRPKALTKVLCNVGDKFSVIWVKDIRLFTKEERYIAVTNIEGREMLTHLTIGHLTEHLVDPMFFQVNRGQIVHKDFIDCYNSTPSGQLDLKLKNERVIKVSRRRAREFKDWLMAAD